MPSHPACQVFSVLREFATEYDVLATTVKDIHKCFHVEFVGRLD
jgi:hypothetical protein